MSIILDGTSGITSPGGDTASVSYTTPIVKSGSSLTLQTNGSTTAVTVTTGQKIGVGTTAPISKLTVIGSGGYDGADATYSGTIQISDDVASAQAVGGLEFKSSSYGSGYGWKICNIDPGGGTPLTINYRDNSATWTEGFRFKSGGLFILKGGNTAGDGTGIAFPATQSASSDANTLDDYEEGTWTPTVFVGATQQTVGTATGTYVKIGKTVFIAFRAENITKSGTGDLSVQSLPFLADVSGNQNKYSEFLVRYAGMNTGGWMQGLIAGASSLISFQNLNSTSGYTGSTTDANLSATYQIYGCTGFYTATA